MMVVAGLSWFAIALGFGFLFFHYLAEGAGLQVFGYFFGVSSTNVLLGLAHLVGFAAAASLCFVIGAGFCAHGLVSPPKQQQKSPKQPEQVQHSIEDTGAVLRCVRCRAPLAAPIHICPDCGWTQPNWAPVAE